MSHGNLYYDAFRIVIEDLRRACTRGNLMRMCLSQGKQFESDVIRITELNN